MRQAYKGAIAAGTSLEDVLTQADTAYQTAIANGRQISEVQASGVVTKYVVPSLSSGLQLQQVIELFESLLSLYERSLLPTTNVPPGGAAANDDQSYQWMMGRLMPIKSFSSDHSIPNIRT